MRRIVCLIICLFMFLAEACQPTQIAGHHVIGDSQPAASPLNQSPSDPLSSAPDSVTVTPVPSVKGSLSPVSTVLDMTESVSPTPVLPSASASLVQPGDTNSGGAGGSRKPVTSPSPTPLPIPTPTMPSNHEAALADLRLPEGPSVLGKDAPGALRADYTGGSIILHAIGYFFDPQPQDVSLSLNNSLDFNLVSASNYVLTFALDTKNIPDLYLEGPHWITLKIKTLEIERQILVGLPITQVSLFPAISGAEVVSSVQTQSSVLEVEGLHFMMNPRFAQAKIDGEVVPILNTHLSQEQSVMQVQLPSGFTEEGSHQLIYSTPFGIAFKSF